MTVFQMAVRAVVGAVVALAVVLTLSLVPLLFVGSGDFSHWGVRAAICYQAVLSALVMAILYWEYVHGLLHLRDLRRGEEGQILRLLLFMGMNLGVLLNVTTGRGELGYATVVPATALLLILMAGLVRRLLPPVRTMYLRLREQLLQVAASTPRKIVN